MGHRHAAGIHAERAYWKNPYGNGLIAPNLWRIFMNYWPLEYIWHICPSNTISKGSVFNSLGLWIRNDLCSTWESADIQHLASKGWISSEKKGDEVQLSKIACHIINIHGIYIIQKSYNQ
jgi:hypothetical protein